jgi:adenylate cyclase
MSETHGNDEAWRGFLMGEMPGLDRSRRWLRRLPSEPRCKLCNAPFGAPGSWVLRWVGGGPSPFNRRLCRWCIKKFHRHPGGAEIEVSALFADVRGSTGLAERMAPQEYSRLLARFYGTAARIVDGENGILDKFVGDEAVALFIPGLAGPRHAERAVAAGRALLRETGNADGGAPWVPIGVGVHTGVSYVGTVGEGDANDFTAVGDGVNATARLSALAGPGELLVSEATAAAAGLGTDGLERRELELRGREEPLAAWVLAA